MIWITLPTIIGPIIGIVVIVRALRKSTVTEESWVCDACQRLSGSGRVEAATTRDASATTAARRLKVADALMIGVFVCFVVIVLAVGAGSQSEVAATSASGQNTSSTRSSQFERLREQFNAESSTLLPTLQSDLDAGHYQAVITKAAPYTLLQDPRLTHMVDLAKAKLGEAQAAEETQRLLSQLKTLGKSAEDERRMMYIQLVDLNPDNAEYRQQLSMYMAKLEERKKARAAAAAKSNTNTVKVATTTQTKPKGHSEGDSVHVGYTTYAVWRSWWSYKLSDNQFLNDPPDAMFLFVELTIRNNDKKARMVAPFYLIDQNGAEYEQTSKGWAVDGAIGQLKSLNPGVSTQGTLIFDVPQNHKYRLKVSGGYWSADDEFIQLSPK